MHNCPLPQAGCQSAELDSASRALAAAIAAGAQSEGAAASSAELLTLLLVGDGSQPLLSPGAHADVLGQLLAVLEPDAALEGELGAAAAAAAAAAGEGPQPAQLSALRVLCGVVRALPATTGSGGGEADSSAALLLRLLDAAFRLLVQQAGAAEEDAAGSAGSDLESSSEEEEEEALPHETAGLGEAARWAGLGWGSWKLGL